MTTHSAIYVGDNTHILELVDLKDHLDAVQTDATVTVTAVTNTAGTAVTGVTVPIALGHVAAGLYRATLAHGGTFVAGRTYKVTFKAVGSQNYRGQWEETLIAQVRHA